MPISIQYRYALLLIWAVFALVTNPVWHAAGHFFSDHSSDATEHVSDVQWSEQDLCPYCDGVSQFTETLPAVSPITSLVRLGDITPVEFSYADHRTRLTTRLRAPPYLA